MRNLSIAAQWRGLICNIRIDQPNMNAYTLCIMVTPRPTSVRANPTNLRRFRDCKRGFKFAVIEHRDRDYPLIGAPLTMGSNVHEALKRLFLMPPDLRSAQKLLEILRNIWRTNYPPDKDENAEYWKRAVVALQRFAQTEDLRAVPVLIEQFLDLNLGDFILSGKIDRVDRDGDGYHDIDYKTGKQAPDKLSLQIYAALVADKLHVDELRVSYLYLERESGNWETEMATREFIDEGLDDVRRQMAIIMAETDFPAEPTYRCKWCQFLPICDEARDFLASRPPSLADEDLPFDFGVAPRG